MPNFIKNRLTIKGKNSKEIIKKHLDNDGDTIEFLTAWTPPTPVIQKLAEMHKDLSIEHEWADEDNGRVTGRAEYKNGTCVSFEKFVDDSKEAYELSFKLLGNANEFCFNEETGTYEYIDD